MRREFRVLSKLWQSYDRAPRAFLLCTDADVLGADFVVMERRLGTVIRDVIPPSMRQLPDVGTRLGFAVVDAMADLHRLSPADCGLDTLGRPEGFLTRQLAGWRERWERVRPPDAPPALDEVPRRLARRMPAPQRVTILHNDLKLDNCQFQPGEPDRVTAVFDWDMATLGDPLVDLGTLLNYWPDPTDPPDACRANVDGVEDMGLPSRREVTERYVARTGFDASEAGWYEAFAQWKTAIVVQQLHDRYSRGETADKRMVHLGARMPVLANSAMKILDEFDHSPN
jgi:aminoglycoside phosphotransferase (APT) family kinase protein